MTTDAAIPHLNRVQVIPLNQCEQGYPAEALVEVEFSRTQGHGMTSRHDCERVIGVQLGF